MKLNEVKITRKYNLGNYESIDITVSVAPSNEEENNVQELILKLEEEITKTKEVLKQNGKL